MVSSDDCSLIKEMKETISDDLSACYTDLELPELIDKCSYLDCRFRTRYLNKEETPIPIKSEALTIADDIYKEKPPQEDEPPPSKKLKGLGGNFDKGSQN